MSLLVYWIVTLWGFLKRKEWVIVHNGSHYTTTYNMTLFQKPLHCSKLSFFFSEMGHQNLKTRLSTQDNCNKVADLLRLGKIRKKNHLGYSCVVYLQSWIFNKTKNFAVFITLARKQDSEESNNEYSHSSHMQAKLVT